MNPRRVASREEVERGLRDRGYEPTQSATATGRYWRSHEKRRHILVPDPYDDMYPDFILQDLFERAERIDPIRVVMQ